MAAYLIISAEAGSTRIRSPGRSPYTPDARASAVARSAEPMTIRSGARKSSSAEPWRRNSGLDTTCTFRAPMAGICESRRAVPTGTVDLMTRAHPFASEPAISATARSRMEVSTAPPGPEGVGRATKTTGASANASWLEAWKLSRPPARPSQIRSSRPGS